MSISQRISPIGKGIPKIPDLELSERIGAGSYGEVWLARNAFATLRAVKIVRRAEFDDDRPYEREFEGIRKFEPISRSHEGFVDLLQVGRNDAEGWFYYVMELADDLVGAEVTRLTSTSERNPGHEESDPPRLAGYHPRTLAAEVKLRGALRLDECLQIALSLTQALEELHRHGLVHRDIKPSNIIFVGGVPKLADIGLVASTNEARSFVGTEGYIPREGPGTAQADLYSLGILLYVMSTGKSHRDFPEPPADLALRPDRERWLELQAIIHRACQTNPRQRYARAEAMRAELELLRRGRSVKRQRTIASVLSTAKRVSLAAGLIVFLAFVVGPLLHQAGGTKRLSSNREAEKLYRQAIYQLQKSTPETFREAFTNLTEAARLDPKLIYGLFEIYWCDGGRKFPPKFEYKANMRWLAETLREHRPNSAEFHVVNSYVEWLAWRFDEALTEIEQAIRDDPRFIRAHALKGFYLLHTWGDAAAARKEYEAAEQIDATDLFTQVQFGHLYYFQRQFQQAIARYTKAAKLEPQNAYAHSWLGHAYEANKQYPEALNEYETEALLITTDPAATKARYESLNESFHLGGEQRWYQDAFDRIRQSQSPSFYSMARLCAKLGRTNEVIPYLHKAYSQHSTFMGWLLFEPTWDEWRDNPEFKEIMEKVGYPLALRSK